MFQQTFEIKFQTQQSNGVVTMVHKVECAELPNFDNYNMMLSEVLEKTLLNFQVKTIKSLKPTSDVIKL